MRLKSTSRTSKIKLVPSPSRVFNPRSKSHRAPLISVQQLKHPQLPQHRDQIQPHQGQIQLLRNHLRLLPLHLPFRPQPLLLLKFKPQELLFRHPCRFLSNPRLLLPLLYQRVLPRSFGPVLSQHQCPWQHLSALLFRAPWKHLVHSLEEMVRLKYRLGHSVSA